VTDDPVGASEWTMMIGRAESVATAIRRNSAATVLTCRIPVIGTAWRAEPGAPTLGRRRGQHPCRGTAPQGGEKRAGACSRRADLDGGETRAALCPHSEFLANSRFQRVNGPLECAAHARQPIDGPA